MKKDPGKLQNIPLSLVCTDGTQCRVETYDIAEMAAEIREEGRVRQPIAAFYDGARYWVGDGHHRIGAARLAGLEKIHALVRKGDQREAVLYAVGANAEHGHRRTNADKRNAVLTLLRDKEWSKWSDRKVAKLTSVDHKSVSRWREDYLGNSPDRNTRKVQRGNTVYEQDTSNIGKRSASDSAGAPWQQAELPGTARPALAPVPSSKPEPKDDDDLSFLAEKRPSTAKPVNAPGVTFGPDPSGPKWFDPGDCADLGSLDEANAVIEIKRFLRFVGEEIERKIQAVSPKYRASVQRKIEDDLIYVGTKVVDLMPPDGKEAAKTRAKFSVIHGGQK